MPDSLAPAFRCRHCGYLQHAATAGENAVPSACRVCGHGVGKDRISGLRKDEPENWEILADAAPERLAELGLKPGEVARHTVTMAAGAAANAAPGSGRVGRVVEASAADGPGTKDR